MNRTLEKIREFEAKLIRKRGKSEEGKKSKPPPRQEPIDEVEEASMESFPASDPPATRRRTE